jgi:3-oxoacyl-[acyl-carrier protein] reductase
MTDSGSGVNGVCETSALFATGAGAFSSLDVHADIDRPMPITATHDTLRVTGRRLASALMFIDLSNRVAIVTGGATGIGFATVRRLAESGASVAIWDRNVPMAMSAVDSLTASGVAPGKLIAIEVDVADSQRVDAALSRTLEHFRRVDILINNAGIVRDAQLAKVKGGEVTGTMSDEDFEAVISVNLRGVFNCTRAVTPHMIGNGFGRIVNASSVVATHGNFGQTNYVAAKAGVIGMTHVWARELGRRGITVNAIAPGFIETDMTAKIPATVLDQMLAHTPVGRLGTPDDVAGAYCFLVSDAAAFINGAVLQVDGGLVIGT